MDLEARLALVRQVGEEIVTEEELRSLLEAKANPVAYDGFEPSGTAHIAQGVMRAINVNKMTQAGCRFKMFVADWHAWANNKMGGDLDKIQVTGKYLIEIWRATGMDLSKVDFVWASEFIEDESYWKKVMNIARDTSLDRVLRTTQIMGRSEKDKLSASQILYPCMQAADIFHLEADLTQLGMDQRKVNMLAREVGPKLGFWKPVVVSHHMLMGLQQPPPQVAVHGILEKIAQHFGRQGTLKTQAGTQDLTPAVAQLMRDFYHGFVSAETFEAADVTLSTFESNLRAQMGEIRRLPGMSGDHPDAGSLLLLSAEIEPLRKALRRAVENETIERANQMKMSKSNPDSAIFMTDTPEQVQAKIKKAFCPAKQAHDNPILEYYRYIIFERFPAVQIERPAKFGGDVAFASYGELERAFADGSLGPVDAKAGAAKYINQLLDPVREHFEKNAAARALKEQVDGFKVTR